MVDKDYYKRAFLNKKKGTASIECAVENGCGYVKITDCNRSARLEFNTYNKDEVTQAAYKLATLIAELTAFQSKLFKGVE